jgi:hypothetical protein
VGRRAGTALFQSMGAGGGEASRGDVLLLRLGGAREIAPPGVAARGKGWICGCRTAGKVYFFSQSLFSIAYPLDSFPRGTRMAGTNAREDNFPRRSSILSTQEKLATGGRCYSFPRDMASDAATQATPGRLKRQGGRPTHQGRRHTRGW